MSLESVQDIVARAKQSLHCLTPAAARLSLEKDSKALVIDVREPAEFAEKRVAGAINIPRGVLEMKITEMTTDPDRAIYLHCATGGRASMAGVALKNMGFRNVSIIDGACDEVIAQIGPA